MSGSENASSAGRKKYETKVTKANAGNHSPRQTRKAWAWIDACSANYTSARLYHLVFVMADLEFRYFGVYHIHKALLKRLMQHLRRKGIAASYHAAREIDDEKGEHLHVYLCVEASIKRPDAILNRKPGDWLATYAAKQGIKVYINEPRDPMHNGLDYMSLPASKPAKIADAKAWVSYLFKARSKPSSGEIYTSSKVAELLGMAKAHGIVLQQADHICINAAGAGREPDGGAAADGDDQDADIELVEGADVMATLPCIPVPPMTHKP